MLLSRCGETLDFKRFISAFAGSKSMIASSSGWHLRVSNQDNHKTIYGQGFENEHGGQKSVSHKHSGSIYCEREVSNFVKRGI